MGSKQPHHAALLARPLFLTASTFPVKGCRGRLIPASDGSAEHNQNAAKENERCTGRTDRIQMDLPKE
jgi:hypothetical protein